MHGDGSGFLVELLEEEVELHWSPGVHPRVDSVVPAFQVVVGSDRGHEDIPVSYPKCGTLEPLPPHISHECCYSVGPGSLVQLMKNWLNMFWRKEG